MSVKKPLRELSVGEIISQSFSLYRARFVQFFAVCLVGGLAIEATTTGVELIFPVPPPPADFQWVSLEALLEYALSFIPPFIVIMVSTIVMFWIVDTVIIEGLLIKYSSDLLEKGSASLRESFNFTISRFLSLLAATYIVNSLIIGGFFLLVVPGIVFFLIFILVEQLVIIERMGALESLARSRRLVSKRWGNAFVLFLIVVFMMFGVGWLSSAALAIPAIISGGPFVISVPPPDPVHGIITSAIMALIRPILTIAFVFFYYSMMAREVKMNNKE